MVKNEIQNKETVENSQGYNKIKENFDDLLITLSELKGKITTIQNSVRVIEKNVKKQLKSLDRKLNKNKNKGSRKPSGFAVPSCISKELSIFMKLDNGVKIARTEVTQYIINYIKQKELQDKKNGRKIKPDKALKGLLNVKQNEDLTYFNLQKYMNKHFVKDA
jgi:chromatin remodeling complex protein RSC6